MRIGGPLAAAALLLAVGCAQAAEPARISPTTPSPQVSAPTAPTATAATPPAPGAAMSDVIRWIAAGRPVDTNGYHTATRDGETAQLNEDIAFTASPGMSCMTASQHDGGALACLVNLHEPPPQPRQVYGEWISGWVDFDGEVLTVGSVHGDPGRFLAGDGPPLPDGSALRFGDYHCRSADDALYCVHYAHQSAARFSPAGIEPFGCLTSVTPPPPDVGRQFSC